MPAPGASCAIPASRSFRSIFSRARSMRLERRRGSVRSTGNVTESTSEISDCARDRNPTCPERTRNQLAGAPGFEPGNGGIKIRCLTTWLRPKTRADHTGAGGTGQRLGAWTRRTMWVLDRPHRDPSPPVMRTPPGAHGATISIGWPISCDLQPRSRQLAAWIAARCRPILPQPKRVTVGPEAG
jgi:hypothetical protein